jgi:predicted AAA+ superfamily ATPase
MKHPRYLKESLLQAFKVSPVTLLIGPRQSGKSTLIKEIGKELGMNYLTFETLKQLGAAQEDPEGFVKALTKPVIIDEVQRVPEIALPIKLAVDEDRVPGSFGLTGSANPLVAPKLNDSLAGRMFILNMRPLSMSEIQGQKSSFLDLIFDPNALFSQGTHWDRKSMVEVFTAGGYPDALVLDDVMRDTWYDNLLTTVLERDVQDIASIARPRDLLKLLNILALRCSNLLNLSEVSRVSSTPYTTLHHYMALLEALFLVIRQPAWHINKTKRLTKMPKLYFGDTGLLINQLRVGKDLISEDGRLLGRILENFVFLELKKLSTWALYPVQLYHYHTQTGLEVDIVLENRSGQVVGIEVKASESISADDWKGLDVLGKELGEKMIRGIILYPGKEVVAFKKDRLAIPLSSLWESRSYI